MAQDDYYYEIQLTNKQLVFYFLAGSAALVLSFLAGVKVGRGVEETASADAGGPRRAIEDRIVPEDPPPTRPPQTAEDLTYAQRLEGEKVDDSLEKPAPVVGAGSPAPRPAATPAPPRPSVAPPASVAPSTTTAAKPTAKPATPKPATLEPKAATPKLPANTAPKPVAAGTFTIQVGAFKDRATADSVATRLKGKGYAAYVVAPDGPEGGLFNVRVGTYEARADAERTQGKLRDEEKYKPFIVRN